MTLPSRLFVSSILSLVTSACATDPGDVGSGSLSGSAEGNDTNGGTQASATDDDGGSTGGTSNGTGNSSSVSATESEGGPTDGGPTGSDSATSTDDAGSSDGTGSGETGTMVADCSECGPDEGCVAEVAFVTEYFCVPIPEDCPGIEFNCACGSEYCVDPFTICQDLPDPPQRQINCECPNC